jgi:HD-GYP domain-containing protein (c-di-GMP phosphodiesterase class II)
MNLTDDMIPVEAKIIAIVDTFSAFTTDRVYKKGENIPTALNILRDVAGTQLDQTLVEYFINIGVERLTELDKLLKGQYGK